MYLFYTTRYIKYPSQRKNNKDTINKEIYTPETFSHQSIYKQTQTKHRLHQREQVKQFISQLPRETTKLSSIWVHTEREASVDQLF